MKRVIYVPCPQKTTTPRSAHDRMGPVLSELPPPPVPLPQRLPDAAARCAAVSVLSMHLLNAIVFGMTYFAVMCATRHHGGAHLNPAITLASFFAGVTPLLQAITLIISQARPSAPTPHPHHHLRSQSSSRLIITCACPPTPSLALPVVP